MHLSTEQLASARKAIAAGTPKREISERHARGLSVSPDVDVSMYSHSELCDAIENEIWVSLVRSLETEQAAVAQAKKGFITIDIEKYHVHLLERVRAVTQKRVIAEREHHDCSAEVRDVREDEMQARLALFRAERDILRIADELTGGIHVLV